MAAIPLSVPFLCNNNINIDNINQGKGVGRSHLLISFFLSENKSLLQVLWQNPFKFMGQNWGIWVAELGKHLALDFGSGRDLWVLRSSLVSGSMLSVESASDSLSQTNKS